jgi:hypothetical protein
LGLFNYFRQFTQGYSKLVAPLTDIASDRKPFVWGLAQHQAFDKMKWALTHAPCLATPDFDKPFQIQSNSSGNGIGAVLLQDKRPVAYFSQKLKPSETNYCIGDKDLLAAY